MGSARDPRFDQADYRPDLYNLVEGPPGTPQEIIDMALAIQCPDCRVNVFIEHHPTSPSGYVFKVAHDDTCPWLTEHEQDKDKS